VCTRRETWFPPTVNDPERILNIDWSILGLGMLFYLLACVAGFARDINKQQATEAPERRARA
jgi:hypothetical protein